MKTTITIAGNMNTTPFDIFNQDVDEVIIIINYYLLLGAENKSKTPPAVYQNDRDESAAFWAAF
jgi:hypothetical protein